MIGTDEKWSLTRETIGDDRLSVILCGRVADGAEASVKALFASRGIDAELVTSAPGGSAGAALKEAFARTRGGYVLLLEGDVVARAALAPEFFAALVKGAADVTVGSKRHPQSVVDYPWHRRWASAVYFAAVRLALGVALSDTESGVMLWRRKTLADALGRMLVKSHAFALELLTIARRSGAVVAEAPTVTQPGAAFGILDFKTIRRVLHDTLAIVYRERFLGYYAKAMALPPPEKQPLVSIVIPCPKRTWMLDEALAAVAKQTYGDWECIVLPDEEDVSRGSGAGSEDECADSRIRFLPTGKIRPAEKRNLGIREAKGEIIAFLDDDAYPDAHWLEYAVRYFTEPSIGAVGGPGVTPPGDTFLARLGGRVYDNLLVSGNYRYRYKAGGVRRDVEDYPSCNLFVRKDLLEKIGGYRTDFWPGEDTLLCKDILDNWKRIVYDPWVVVYHHRRPLFLPHLRQLGRYGFHRGYFAKRFPSNSLRLSYFIPSAFDGYLLALAAVWAAGAPLAFAAIASAPLALYLALVALTTFSVNPLDWALTAAGVAASHLWYGLRFLQGLSARRAPCEYIGGDHASATHDESKQGLNEET